MVSDFSEQLKRGSSAALSQYSQMTLSHPSLVSQHNMIGNSGMMSGSTGQSASGAVSGGSGLIASSANFNDSAKGLAVLTALCIKWFYFYHVVNTLWST